MENPVDQPPKPPQANLKPPLPSSPETPNIAETKMVLPDTQESSPRMESVMAKSVRAVVKNNEFVGPNKREQLVGIALKKEAKKPLTADEIKLAKKYLFPIFMFEPSVNITEALVEKHLSNYNISKQSISEISRVAEMHGGSNEILIFVHGKAVNELIEKLFKQSSFGMDDKLYASRAFVLAMRSGEEDIKISIKKINSISDELLNIGLNKEAVIRIMHNSIDIETLIGMSSDFKEQFAEIAESIKPGLKDKLTQLFLKGVNDGIEGDGVFLSVEKHPEIKELLSMDRRIFKYALPDFINKVELRDNGLVMTSNIINSFRFLYRGEGSELKHRGLGMASIIDVFDEVVKNKGMGMDATKDISDSGTYTSPNLNTSSIYTNPNGGVWILDKDVINEIPVESHSSDVGFASQIVFAKRIPLKYAKYLIVADDVRTEILKKYGAENTDIFDRPLKNVIVGIKKESEIGENHDIFKQQVIRTLLKEYVDTKKPMADVS